MANERYEKESAQLVTSPAGLSLRLPGLSGSEHNERRAGTAAGMVTVYVVLLLGIPSNLTLGSLGTLGRPAMLWGLVLLSWWMLARAQASAADLPPIAQPLRAAIVVFLVIVLTSFAAAMLRGQPPDQVSPAVTSTFRVASWTGVLLITMDGVRTRGDALFLVRALAIAGGALGGLGLAQFLTGSPLLGWMTHLPGVSIEDAGVVSRGTYTRASGTATHPLEYTTVLASLMPLALVTAIYQGTWKLMRFQTWVLRISAGLIASAAMIAISRSALIGLMIAAIASLPALPRLYRWIVVISGGALGAVLVAAIPGLLGTVVGLFIGANTDPSTASRTAALALAPSFISTSPVIGVGFGTFLPRYYIFDNQWLLLAVELGVLGVFSFAFIGLIGIWNAWRAATISPDRSTESISRAVGASIFTIMVLFFFFDGLSFPQSAGLFFVMAGISAAMRTISKIDAPRQERAPLSDTKIRW